VCVLAYQRQDAVPKAKKKKSAHFFFGAVLAHIPENGKDGYLVIALLSKLDTVVITTRTPVILYACASITACTHMSLNTRLTRGARVWDKAHLKHVRCI
jgi:hypothetical protein